MLFYGRVFAKINLYKRIKKRNPLDEYLQNIVDIISVELKIDKNKIDESSEFVSDLQLDSLDMMDMIMVIEKHFKIMIPEHEIGELVTVKDLVEYIKKKVVK